MSWSERYADYEKTAEARTKVAELHLENIMNLLVKVNDGAVDPDAALGEAAMHEIVLRAAMYDHELDMREVANLIKVAESDLYTSRVRNAARDRIVAMMGLS